MTRQPLVIAFDVVEILFALLRCPESELLADPGFAPEGIHLLG